MATVIQSWVGKQTVNGFSVTAKVADATSVALQADTSAAFADPVTGAVVSVDVDGYATVSVSGLNAATHYYWRLVSAGAPFGSPGRCWTSPVGESSFTVAFGHCLSSTNGVAFTRILGRNPLAFFHLGDMHYFDETSTSAAVHRGHIEYKLSTMASTYGQLFSNVATYYTRSDHDGGGTDNQDPNPAYTPNMQAVAQVSPGPYTGNTSSGLYGSVVLGRVRFIRLDTRNMNRSPSGTVDGPGKTMLGATQKAWLKAQLLSPEPLKVIVSDPPWVGTVLNASTVDKWPNYATERNEIAEFITENAVNVVMLVGDFHASFTSTGVNNPYGGFPVFAAGPFNQTGTAQAGSYDWLADAGGTAVQRYGTLSVEDLGESINVTYKAFNADTDTELRSQTVSFALTESASNARVWMWDGEEWVGNDSGLLNDKSVVTAITDTTNERFMGFDIHDDGSSTFDWPDRLQFRFESPAGSGVFWRTGGFNEYGEIRADAAKVNTVASRVHGHQDGSTGPIFQVRNKRGGTVDMLAVSTSEVACQVPLTAPNLPPGILTLAVGEPVPSGTAPGTVIVRY